jgi:hypothetical protein
MFSPRRIPRLAFLCGIGVVLVLLVASISEIGTHAFAASAQTANHAAADNTAVTTYKEDNSHTGSHTTETILNTTNVNQNTFGKHVTYKTDGQVYAQPLYLPAVTIGGTSHNVVYVATENDSVYAFDADQTSAGAPLWHTSFLTSSSVVAPSNTDVSCNDVVPKDGLTGTPVIDRSTGTLYVVALTKENGSFVYHLHALDIATGQEKAGSPTKIQATVAGTGAGSVKGKLKFNPQTQRQRTGLLLANGKIYIAWGSFCDNPPYHGWIMSYSYNAGKFQQVSVYTDTANSSEGGIWAVGGGLSADSNGNIYYTSGNGGFDANKKGVDYGDSVVRLNAQLKVQDYFAPFNQQCLSAIDGDLGSGGPLLLPDQHRLITAGKEGRVYVINTTDMGHYHTIAKPCNNLKLTNVDRIVQELPAGTTGGLFSNVTYWSSASGQQYVYFSGTRDKVKAFSWDSNSSRRIATAPSSKSPETFGATGSNPTISSNNGAAGTGILWTIDPAGILRAYDATDLNKELYNSNQDAARDSMGSHVKYTAPTVANGEVFVGLSDGLEIFGQLTTSSASVPALTSNTQNALAMNDDHARLNVGSF